MLRAGADAPGGVVRPYLPFVLLLLAVVVAYHAWAPRHVPPIHDASNCVASASNLGLALERGDLGTYWAPIRTDPNTLLSLAYFSLFELAFGPGRPAWGWAWGLLVVLWYAGAWRLGADEEEKRRLLAASALFFACGPWMFRPGGLLDERFDPLSALLTSGTALCLSLGRLRGAASLSVLAVLAKGPALALNILLWTAAFLTGVVGPRKLRDDVRRHPYAWVSLAVAAGVYLWVYLPRVTSYNLMAVKAPTAQAKAVLFLRGSGHAIWSDRYFYPSNLLRTTPLFSLLVVGTVAAAAATARSDERRPRLRLAAFGALFLALTYLLLSAHPLKNQVLIVWFAPSAWMLALASSEILPIRRPGLASALTSLALMTQLVRVADRLPFVQQPELRGEFEALRRHAEEIGRALQSRALEGGTVRLVTNFLWARDPSLSYNYDAYRVLLFESMGRRTPRLEGWELGTWSDDWRAELAHFPSSEWFLAVIAAGGEDEVHHRHRARGLARQFRARVNRACELPVAASPAAPALGRIRVYLTRPDLRTCAAVVAP